MLASLLRPSREVGVDLYWLPLGAGGHFVRFNGRVYELIQARRGHRPPLDLYHTALEVTVPEGRYVIESAWPIPDAHPETRGVTVGGSVFARRLGRFRTFRYEVRRWGDGAIPDIAWAVDSPQRVTNDEEDARNVLALTTSIPHYVWGRDELHLSEMWNSNSVVAWLLTKAGLPIEDLSPPRGGRAPGWLSGVVVARRMNAIDKGDATSRSLEAVPSKLRLSLSARRAFRPEVAAQRSENDRASVHTRSVRVLGAFSPSALLETGSRDGPLLQQPRLQLRAKLPSGNSYRNNSRL